MTTSLEILATVKTLKARARKAKKIQSMSGNAHLQIANRRIADAVLFAERNTEHAEKCCWEARYHLNLCGFD